MLKYLLQGHHSEREEMIREVWVVRIKLEEEMTEVELKDEEEDHQVVEAGVDRNHQGQVVLDHNKDLRILILN